MSELPKGWEWVSLDDIRPDDAPIIYGILQPGHDVDNGVRYVRPTEIVNDHIDVPNLRRTTPEIANRYKRASLLANDIVFSIVGSIGKVAVVPSELMGANITQSSARIRPDSKIVEPLYLKRAMKAPLFVEQCNDYQLGSAVPRLNLEDVRRLRIPLAPLNEQRSIIAKLEKVLSRVDAAQARLATIPRILKRFRQSVLDAACSGRLTADWRSQRADSVRKNSNKPHRLKDIARFIDYRGKTPRKTSEGVPLITAKNIRQGYLSLEPKEYIAREDYKPWMTRGIPKIGDVLITTEAPLGNVVCVDWSYKFALAQRVICLQFDQTITEGRYASLVMRSPAFQEDLLGEATGSMVTGIKAARLKELSVVFPMLEEQAEIVRRVEALFKTADALEARYRTAKAHVDRLTQSILAKAFRGELVPQDPNDEPASVLLDRIRQKSADDQQKMLLKRTTKRGDAKQLHVDPKT